MALCVVSPNPKRVGRVDVALLIDFDTVGHTGAVVTQVGKESAAGQRAVVLYVKGAYVLVV